MTANGHNFKGITRSGAGQYTVDFDEALASSDYTVLLSYEDTTATIQSVSSSSHGTTSFNVGIRDSSNNLSDDSESVSFVIFQKNA